MRDFIGCMYEHPQMSCSHVLAAQQVQIEIRKVSQGVSHLPGLAAPQLQAPHPLSGSHTGPQLQ